MHTIWLVTKCTATYFLHMMAAGEVRKVARAGERPGMGMMSTSAKKTHSVRQFFRATFLTTF